MKAKNIELSKPLLTAHVVTHRNVGSIKSPCCRLVISPQYTDAQHHQTIIIDLRQN